MSQANVEVVRRLFDGYRRGDYAEAAECLAGHVVYEIGQELRVRGREEVRAIWERWDELETVPEEFIDAGQKVLVTARPRPGQRNQVRGAPLRRLHLQRWSVRSQAGVQRVIRGHRGSGPRPLAADG
jgi:ketosteroid isomerase-like protein